VYKYFYGNAMGNKKRCTFADVYELHTSEGRQVDNEVKVLNV